MLMRVAFIGLMGLIGPISVAQPSLAAPYPIGEDSQLFVDDLLIAEKSGLTRSIHACEKLDRPVLEADKPWEGTQEDQRVYIYGTVLRDPETGHFRMWYNKGSYVLYATSEDGLEWEKADLGLIRIQGSKANNCVLASMHSPSVVYNPKAPEKETYAMLASCKSKISGRGYSVAFSPDGLHWRRYSKNPVLPSGDTCTLTYDLKTQQYLAYHKRNVKWRGPERRTVYLATSPDMKTWSEAKLVMGPDEVDDAQVKAEGGKFGQFYNMSVAPYGDHFLGFVTHFRYFGDLETTGPGQSRNDGPIDVQLTHSRDGRAWSRTTDRSPVIPNGPHAYDAGCILGLANDFVRVGDELWMYYTAINTTHGGALPEKKIVIALAKWRLDGFVSLDAGEAGGLLRTQPLRCSGDRLYVNATAQALSAAVLDAEGKVLPGYAHEDCRSISGDSVRHALAWKGKEALPTNQPLCFEFRMKQGRFYAFAVRGA